MWLCWLTLKIWHEIGVDKFVFIGCENKESSNFAFRNKYLSVLHPKITPTSEPQVICLSGCCYKAPKSNGVPGKRTKCYCIFQNLSLSKSFLSIFMQLKISLTLPSAQTPPPRYSTPVSWSRELCSTDWCLTVSSAQCLHASFYNFPHPKFKQTQIN
jgi:hypothetical protein